MIRSGDTAKRMPALDGLRGLALLLVLLGHVYQFAGPYEAMRRAWPRAGAVLGRIGTEAGLGVDLFFVLSGFLITGILLDARGSDHYFRNFYARRFLRIFPLYYATLAVTLWLIPAVASVREPRFADLLGQQRWLWLYAVNLPVAWGQKWGSELFQYTHFWSLAVEEHFYLVWPLVVWLCSGRTLRWVCVGLMIASPALRTTLMAVGVDGWNASSFTPCRLDGLTLGGLIALLVRSDDTRRQLARYAPKMFLVTFPLLLGYVARPRSLDALGATLGLSAIALCFGSVLVLSLDDRSGSRWQSFLRTRFMRTLGKYSYGLYVLHFLIQPLYKRVLPTERLLPWTGALTLTAVLQMLCWFGISLAAAWVSWHLWEKHFLRLKRFFEYAPRSVHAERVTWTSPAATGRPAMVEGA
jgi:peptidoglycan/LPS O-acetylase OafA/YrhL